MTMMMRSVVGALLAATMIPAAPARAQGPTPPPEEAAIKTELVALETNIWKAWASKNEDFYFARMTPDVTVLIIGQGRMSGRDTVVEEISASPCKMNDFTLSREELRLLAPTVALLTYQAKQDAICAGHKLPENLLVSSIYVRTAEGWKMSSYQETRIEGP